MGQQIDDEVLSLIRSSIRSIWTLELLMLLYRDRGREWTEAGLVSELRASFAIVRDSLAELNAAGLTARHQPLTTVYEPGDSVREDTVRRLVEYYDRTPAAVMKAIAAAPDDRIQIFADAFRFLRK